MGLVFPSSRLTLSFPIRNMHVRGFSGHLTLLLSLISLARVSGAVIKGYEKDVGTKTSFYGFTAYSLVSSLQILGHRGFSNIPQEKVSEVPAVCMHSFDKMLFFCGLQFCFCHEQQRGRASPLPLPSVGELALPWLKVSVCSGKLYQHHPSLVACRRSCTSDVISILLLWAI